MSAPSLWPEPDMAPASLETGVRIANETGVRIANSLDVTRKSALDEIMELDLSLLHHFRDRLIVDPSLTRPLVSFQANKNKVGYRWYKFKEAFSASLIEHLLQRYGANQGRVLDPFAGSGTTLFVASANGLAADGIEVLPIGQKLIAARMLFEAGLDTDDLEVLHRWARTKPWTTGTDRVALRELRITKGAYPAQTVEDIEKYLSAIQTENERVRSLLLFALLSVIESVSYTRKDGQYLRWDYRSGRAQGAKVFDKGTIHDFDTAIRAKIDEIVFDMQNRGKSTDLFPTENQPGEIRLFPGSCLDVLPLLPGSHYDAVITSPPYCNRYDYTRTYALELALLGVGEHELIQLRQQMLSCTVENRAKDLLRINPHWAEAIAAADDQPLLQRVLAYLEEQKAQGALNNNGIPRMMRGYFYEMACVIAECVRVMKPGALLIMVNDNVRYAGASVSVDLILSDFAGKLGFGVERILVLPGGKGNSSQQMGEHGREALRKCVYVWRRSKFSIEIIVSDRTAGSNPKP